MNLKLLIFLKWVFVLGLYLGILYFEVCLDGGMSGLINEIWNMIMLIVVLICDMFNLLVNGRNEN